MEGNKITFFFHTSTFISALIPIKVQLKHQEQNCSVTILLIIKLQEEKNTVMFHVLS